MSCHLTKHSEQAIILLRLGTSSRGHDFATCNHVVPALAPFTALSTEPLAATRGPAAMHYHCYHLIWCLSLFYPMPSMSLSSCLSPPLMPFSLRLPTNTTTSLFEAACSPLLVHALIDPPQNSALSLPLEAGPLTSSSLVPKGCLSGLLSQGFPSTPSTLLQGQHPPLTPFPSSFLSPPRPIGYLSGLLTEGPCSSSSIQLYSSPSPPPAPLSSPLPHRLSERPAARGLPLHT